MLGHVIYNYAYLDDARIQQEISKKLYGPVFGGVHLVQTYNGKPEFGYEKYLEDELIQIKNPGHFQGAVDLINAGLAAFEKKPEIRYVLVTAADTWILNLDFLKGIIDQMEREGRTFAASSWCEAVAPAKPDGFSTDFFILDMAWNREAKLFPLDFPAYKAKFKDYIAFRYSTPLVERAVQYHFQKYFMEKFEDNNISKERDKKLRRISEREPVHIANPKGDSRRQEWPEIGLYTSPNLVEGKQKALQQLGKNLGPHTDRFMKATDLTYFNNISRI